MRKILLALFAGLLPALSSEREQRFAFALPEVEGRISLGVFDSEGKLVRTLCVGAQETDFVVGLNGLITTWDGENDEGQPLGAGKYRVRGYLVGDALKAEGVAYHFNDWINDEKSPRITRIEDFRRQPGGFVVLAQTSDSKGPLIFRFDQLRGFLWTNSLNAPAPATKSPGSEPLPGQSRGATFPLAEFRGAAGLSSPTADTSRMLATTDHYATVFFAGSIHLLKMDDGTTIKTLPESVAHATCMDASDDMLFIGASENIVRIALPGLDPIGDDKTPVAFNALAANGERKLGASSSGSEVWESPGAQWKKLPLSAAVSSLSFGLEGTFWVTAIDAENGEPFTGQFDKDGEFLRAYRDAFSPVKVCASTAIEEIAVLETSGSAQRLRVLSLEHKPDAPGNWAIAFEKTIQDCRRFGIVKGKLAADAGASPQIDHVNITLATGGLTPSSPSLAVRVTFDHAGLWLETQSGLRLAFLASQPNVRRVALLLGPEKEFLTVYAGDDAVVAEYAVRGLGDIVEIDAGEVELPKR
ncbi:MAG TPA: FlgD immunoglobulin-like domain containing protein [Terrimicrobiaceae bacterium]